MWKYVLGGNPLKEEAAPRIHDLKDPLVTPRPHPDAEGVPNPAVGDLFTAAFWKVILSAIFET